MDVSFETDIECFYKISMAPLTQPPIFDSIRGCIDKSWCGEVKIGKYGNQISSADKSLKYFIVKQEYHVWVGCYYQFPNAKEKSDVKSKFQCF